MQLKLFGRSGLRVSEISLGTMNFGAAPHGIDKATSMTVLDTYANEGGNFLDTAHVYAGGESEPIVGDFVRTDRDHFVVATKYTPTSGSDLMKAGNSRKTMMQMVNESLKRLNTDYIDLYYIHFWDYTTRIEEVMRGLDDLVRMGKVLYVAASDMPAWEISRGNMLADLRGWSAFAGMQIEYSLIERTPERDLLPMAYELGLGITVWGPLAGGALLSRDTPRAKVTPMTPRVENIVKVVKDISAETGRPASQVALAFVRQKTRFGYIHPIVGASSRAQLLDNLGCLKFKLARDHLDRLEAVSKVDLGFPHEFLKSSVMRNFATASQPEKLDNHRAIGD